MFSFLKPAPDAKVKVPTEKVVGTYRLRQTGVLLSICIGYIGYYIIRLIFTTEQNDIMKAYGFTTADIGLLMSGCGLGYGLSKLFMGALSDESNPKWYLATGLFISAIMNFGLGSTRDLYAIMLLMLVMSVAQGMGAAACQRTVQLWWGKKRRGTVYAVWSSAHNAGAFVCVAVVQIATLMFTHSIAAVFYTASVVSIVIAIFIVLAGADRPETVGLPSIGEYTGDEVVLDDGQATSAELTDLFVADFRSVHFYQQGCLGYHVDVNVLIFSPLRHYELIPSYLTQFKGFDPETAKWLVGIFELAAVPGVILMGVISDLLKGRRAIVCIGCDRVTDLSHNVLLSTNHLAIIIVLLIMGSLIYAPLTLVGLMVNESVPKFAVGSSTGFMGFFQYIFGETLATALIGILVAKFGWIASNTVLYTAAGLALLLLCYIAIHEHHVAKIAAGE